MHDVPTRDTIRKVGGMWQLTRQGLIVIRSPSWTTTMWYATGDRSYQPKEGCRA